MTFRPRSRTIGGVKRIIRDNYGPKWYTHVKEIDARDEDCLECRKLGLKSVGPYHTHHIRPLSRGGTTTKANTFKLCEKHHQKRHPSHSVKKVKS